jgi:uncharacterized protein (TIGR02270 family)
MTTSDTPPPEWNTTLIATVVQQHVEEAAILWQLRSAGAKRPNFSVMYLDRFDRRLHAHLDGLAVAGVGGSRFLDAALESPTGGAVFAATTRAIDEGDERRLDRMFALASSLPETRAGLISAFGWLDRSRLEGVVARMLASDDPFRQTVGLAACALHRVSPGRASIQPGVHAMPRARGLRAVGELGNLELVPTVAQSFDDEDPGCQFWASWSGVLCGNRGQALERLVCAVATGPWQRRALNLAVQAMDVSAGHRLLQEVATESRERRSLICGSGIVGDPMYIPWLIGHMAEDRHARLAGEAFSLITGTDLAALGLDRRPPEDFESGPNDNPEDSNVEMDPDDGLPWPDPERVKHWWTKNGIGFQPGRRYFMGAPVTRAHCMEVLKNGYQRQRILAAHYLCLLDPGTQLFNTSAPAWRQQKLLAQMK